MAQDSTSPRGKREEQDKGGGLKGIVVGSFGCVLTGAAAANVYILSLLFVKCLDSTFSSLSHFLLPIPPPYFLLLGYLPRPPPPLPIKGRYQTNTKQFPGHHNYLVRGGKWECGGGPDMKKMTWYPTSPPSPVCYPYPSRRSQHGQSAEVPRPAAVANL